MFDQPLNCQQPDLSNSKWHAANRDAVLRRLEWLLDKPNGVLFDRKMSLHRIMINKMDSIIKMFFVDPYSDMTEFTMSGAMSALDLNDPFDLTPTPYNQAMMLSLLWKPQPQRIYLVGFAGGHVPLVFYHFLPETIIESADIDPDVVELAKRFFGIELNQRQRIFIQDGRSFLSSQPENVKYDIILLDAYRGTGYSPLHLCTIEFFEICKNYLAHGGVVAANLVPSDPFIYQRLATLRASFKYVYIQVNRTIVAFGAGCELTDDEIASRSQALQEQHKFVFPFVRRAQSLKRLDSSDEYKKVILEALVLTDALSSSIAREFLSPKDPVFYNVKPDDACPCGSGDKYRRCHGKNRPPAHASKKDRRYQKRKK